MATQAPIPVTSQDIDSLIKTWTPIIASGSDIGFHTFTSKDLQIGDKYAEFLQAINDTRTLPIGTFATTQAMITAGIQGTIKLLQENNRKIGNDEALMKVIASKEKLFANKNLIPYLSSAQLNYPQTDLTRIILNAQKLPAGILGNVTSETIQRMVKTIQSCGNRTLNGSNKTYREATQAVLSSKKAEFPANLITAEQADVLFGSLAIMSVEPMLSNTFRTSNTVTQSSPSVDENENKLIVFGSPSPAPKSQAPSKAATPAQSSPPAGQVVPSQTPNKVATPDDLQIYKQKLMALDKSNFQVTNADKSVLQFGDNKLTPGCFLYYLSGGKYFTEGERVCSASTSRALSEDDVDIGKLINTMLIDVDKNDVQQFIKTTQFYESIYHFSISIAQVLSQYVTDEMKRDTVFYSKIRNYYFNVLNFLMFYMETHNITNTNMLRSGVDLCYLAIMMGTKSIASVYDVDKESELLRKIMAISQKIIGDYRTIIEKSVAEGVPTTNYVSAQVSSEIQFLEKQLAQLKTDSQNLERFMKAMENESRMLINKGVREDVKKIGASV